MLSKKLKPHVEAIKADAEAGNHNAQQIIQMYQLHVDCPQDPGAPALCEAFFKDWLKDKNHKA